jgi:hypothetical protein
VLWLDAPLAHPARPAIVERGGPRRTMMLRPIPENFGEGLERRGDPPIAAPARITSRPRG